MENLEKNKKISVEFCIPIFNEEKILEKNVKRLFDYCVRKNFSFSWKIIILNNGSTDNSSAIGEKMKRAEINIVNISEKGRGQAIKNYWEKSRADIVAYMDIDLAVSLDNISDLINPLIKEGFDLTIGSRLLPESKIERAFIRELSSRTYNLVSRLACGHKFFDLQCGFKAIKTGVFRRLSPLIRDSKWFFDTELVVFASHYGCKVKEVPVEWSENRYDKRKSKVNLFRDTVTFLINLVKLRINLTGLDKNK